MCPPVGQGTALPVLGMSFTYRETSDLLPEPKEEAP
jgi:hypothetical protein